MLISLMRVTENQKWPTLIFKRVLTLKFLSLYFELIYNNGVVYGSTMITFDNDAIFYCLGASS